MVELQEACEMAVKYLNKKITKALETDSLFIFYGGKKKEILVGGAGVSINKITREIKPFILPNKDNFEILKSAKEIEIMSKYSS